MKILVIGGGGREHALIWKINQSPLVKKIYCAPGNAGIRDLAECIAVGAEDVDGLLAFARGESIDLTVVGPEGPLAEGLVDRFEAAGLKAFGVSRNAARLESSKMFAKDVMNRYGIPTARGEAFNRLDRAEAYVRKIGAPLVVKADGLAAGKGVYVCRTEKEALEALHAVMKAKVHGDAGQWAVVEECLRGEEASFLALTDGETVLPLPSSQDHKAIFDDDKGANTGGMGAYSPAPVVDRLMHEKIMKEIMIPIVKAMAAEGCPFKGVLYAGLMIDRDRVNVLEFNARFGDPETQPLLMRIKNDIVPLMTAVADGKLNRCRLEIDERAAVCVVMASKGYPGSYKKGMPIQGLDAVRRMKDVVAFHAGTGFKDGRVVATGGRVLGVTAIDDTVQKAIERAYRGVAKISWDGAYYRSDIGRKALKRIGVKPVVGIVMGSDSDLPVMRECAVMLQKFGIPFEMTVASAHRSPARAAAYARDAKDRGLRVIVAGAGMAAHLAGSLAAHTTLPVIGVPIDASPLNGLDALLSTVQMPPGIPVATVAIGKPGARNAGVLAAQILALSDPEIAGLLAAFKTEMEVEVARKAAKLADG